MGSCSLVVRQYGLDIKGTPSIPSGNVDPSHSFTCNLVINRDQLTAHSAIKKIDHGGGRASQTASLYRATIPLQGGIPSYTRILLSTSARSSNNDGASNTRTSGIYLH